MRCFLDTNVFIAAVLDTDESEATGTATALLNDTHEFLTSLLTLMELRTVLNRFRTRPGLTDNRTTANAPRGLRSRRSVRSSLPPVSSVCVVAGTCGFRRVRHRVVEPQ
jgi:predicted nucleic acid-binding protein